MAKRVVDGRTGRAARARFPGRRPGQWEQTSPGAISAFRARHSLSRARLASLLGVSTTAVHNWERGQVASARCQKQLADLLAVGPGAFVPARPSSGAGSPDDVVSSVGVIVAAYLARHGAHLQPEALTPLIRAVRGALS